MGAKFVVAAVVAVVAIVNCQNLNFLSKVNKKYADKKNIKSEVVIFCIQRSDLRIKERNIMQFNQYNWYSLVAGNNNDSSKEMEKVLALVESFKNIISIEDAKEYLADNFEIKDVISNYPLGADSYLTTKENDKRFSVSIRYADENQIFSYLKK